MNITLEDGTTREVPDELKTQREVRKYLADNPVALNRGGGITAPSAVMPPDKEAMLLGPGGMAAVRGGRDVAQGAIRLGLKALRAAGAIDDSTLQDFEEHAAETQAAYDEKMKRNFPNASGMATEGGRILGQGIMTSPVGAVKVAGAVGPVARVATNAIQGGISGAVLAKPENDLGAQTAFGVATGAIVPEVVRVGLRGLGSLSSWAQSKMGARSPGSIIAQDVMFGELSPKVVEDLKKAGIDWEGLPDRTKQNVTNWVRQNAGKTELTPVEAARLGIFEGAKPTKAMVTRSSADYNRELDIARQPAGEELKNAYARVHSGVADKLEMETNRYQGTTTDKPTAGLRAIDALQAGVDESKAARDAAYAAAKEDPAIKDKISLSHVRNYLKSKNADFESSDELTALRRGILAKLEELGAYGPGAKPISVERAESLREWLGTKWKPNNPEVQQVIQELKSTIDDTVLGAGKGKVFEKARTAHRLLKETYYDKQLVRDLLNQRNPVDRRVAVEDSWDRIVLKSDVAQLADLKNTLQKGSRVTMGPGESETVARGNEAWRDIQSTTLKHLADKAQMKARGHGDTPIFDYGKLKDAMNEIGKERLHIVLGGEGVKELNQVLEQIRLAKPLSGIGSSSQGSTNRIWHFFQNYFPRMAGGAAGATAGGPMGAAAGAAAGETLGAGARSVGTGYQARLMSNAERAINASRRPSADFTGATPPGFMVPPVTNSLLQTFTQRKEQ